MDYQKLIKKSLKYSWNNKFLWLLGILTASGGYYNSTDYQFGNDQIPNDFKDLKGVENFTIRDIFVNASESVRSIPKFFGASMDYLSWAIPVILIILILLLVIAIYLNITSKSAILWAVDEIDEGKSVGLKDSWKIGHRFFWRRLSLGLIYALLIFVPLLVLSIPLIILAIYEFLIPTILLSVIFGLVLMVYFIYLALFMPYAERFLVLSNKKVMQSIMRGREILTKKWREIIIIYLLVFAARIIAMLAVGIVLVVLALMAAPLGIIIFKISSVMLLVYISFLTFIFILLAIIFSGFVASFNSSLVTLTYKTINK